MQFNFFLFLLNVNYIYAAFQLLGWLNVLQLQLDYVMMPVMQTKLFQQSL